MPILNHPQNWPPLCDWSIASIVKSTPQWLKGKCARIVTGGFRNDFTESQAASRSVCIFSAKIAPFRVFEEGYRKHFQSSNFKRASWNFDNFINKETKNCKKHQRMYRKYLFNIISLQKNIHLVTKSLSAISSHNSKRWFAFCLKFYFSFLLMLEIAWECTGTGGLLPPQSCRKCLQHSLWIIIKGIVSWHELYNVTRTSRSEIGKALL